jgi:RNA polymerase sigma-70 factor (ECF subfamily)
VTPPGEPVDDRQLLAAHLTGDPDAFNKLVARHRDRLWAVALRTTGDREEAFDAVQDALLSALRAAPRFRGDAAVSTWLHRIVVNASLDRLRRRAARPAVPLDQDFAAGPVHPGDDASTVTRLDVHAALARLPEPQRLAVILVDLEDLPVAEAAEVLGVAEGTVKSRCSRGRLALARALGDSYRSTGQPGGRRSAGNPTPAAGVGKVVGKASDTGGQEVSR